jgi:zinc protease
MDEEIKSIKATGPSKENLNKVKLQWIESNRTAMKRNGIWVNFILSSKLENKDVDRFLNYEKYVNALTEQGVQDAANKILGGKNKVTAVLLPEKKSESIPENN